MIQNYVFPCDKNGSLEFTTSQRQHCYTIIMTQHCHTNITQYCHTDITQHCHTDITQHCRTDIT